MVLLYLPDFHVLPTKARQGNSSLQLLFHCPAFRPSKAETVPRQKPFQSLSETAIKQQFFWQLVEQRTENQARGSSWHCPGQTPRLTKLYTADYCEQQLCEEEKQLLLWVFLNSSKSKGSSASAAPTWPGMA